MDPTDTLLERARAAALQGEVLPTAAVAEHQGALREALSAQQAGLPELPAYRRTGDKAREQAGRQLEGAMALVERAHRLRRARAEGDAEGSARSEALVAWSESQARLLGLLEQGRIDAAHEQLAQLRAVATQSALAFGGAPLRRPVRGAVWDAQSGESRFDPREVAPLTVALTCPESGCRRTGSHSVSQRLARNDLTCPHCRSPFIAWLAVLRSHRSGEFSRAIRHVLMLEELGGAPREFTIDDTSGGHLPLAPGDLVALLYDRRNALVGISNLTATRTLWIRSRDACFLVSAVYGPTARELDGFRAFRDDRLLPHPIGRLAVAGYYRLGPSLAFAVKGLGLAPHLRPAFDALGRRLPLSRRTR